MSQADVRPKHSRAGLVVGRLGPMPLNAPVPVAPKGRSEAQDAETAKALAHAVEMDAASARCFHVRFCRRLWLRSHDRSLDLNVLLGPRMTPRSLVVVRSQPCSRRAARSHSMDLLDLLTCLLAPQSRVRSLACPKCTPRVGLQWRPHVEDGVEAVTLFLMALLDRCDLSEPVADREVPPMRVHRLQDFCQSYEQLAPPSFSTQELDQA